METKLDETWEKQESSGMDIWQPKEQGETLVGAVVNIGEGMYGKYYIILNKDNEEIKTPSHKVLQSRLVNVAQGDVVTIVYLGHEKSKYIGRKPTEIYEVYKKIILK